MFETFIELNNIFLISVIDDGTVIRVKDEHSEKAQFPIDVIDDGIVTCVSDEHQMKM